jgi:hypothetical protein
MIVPSPATVLGLPQPGFSHEAALPAVAATTHTVPPLISLVAKKKRASSALKLSVGSSN